MPTAKTTTITIERRHPARVRKTRRTAAKTARPIQPIPKTESRVMTIDQNGNGATSCSYSLQGRPPQDGFRSLKAEQLSRWRLVLNYFKVLQGEGTSATEVIPGVTCTFWYGNAIAQGPTLQ